MENSRRYCLVAKSTNSFSYQSTNEIDFQESEFNWSSVPLSEVIQKNNRLEASNFEIKVRAARQLIKDCKWPVVNLWSDNGLVKNAQYPGRFKRIYVNRYEGYPFYLPTQITDLYPKPTKWISPITHSGLNILKAHDGELLINRSGTIGPVTIVSKTLKDKILSDDIIRVIPSESNDLGYLYAFLKTSTGQVLLTTNSYGAVISHIEPEHLQNLPIPNPNENLKKDIHNLIIDSFIARDTSNELMDQAEILLIEELRLPSIEELKPKYFQSTVELQNYEVKLSNLKNRLDGSYHIPVVNKIISHIKNTAREVTFLGDKRISNKIILPTRFKRVYVEEGEGRKFLGGRDIFQLNPSTTKYISTTKHSKKIQDDLKISENNLIFPSRGTVKNVVIAPKHFEGWCISDNLISVLPSDINTVGYVFSFLNTFYGKILINRQISGSVVDFLEIEQLSSVEVPFLKNQETQLEVNALVLKANKLRYDAYLKEQQAIKKVNDLVIHASKYKLNIAAEPKVKFVRNKK